MVQITEDITTWASSLAGIWPGLEVITLPSTGSTNNWLREHRAQVEGRTCLLMTDFQTAGRGSGTNHWESQEGINLTFSLQVCPTDLPASRMFALSEVMSLGVSRGLEEALSAEGGLAHGHFHIKWPNDVYYRDGKVCGMLIENDLQGKRVERSVMGVGINVNQDCFVSDAPNPMSLRQIAGHEFARAGVLASVLASTRLCLEMMEHGAYDDLYALYLGHVYRWREWHRFTDQGGTFEGMISNIEPDGHLVVQDRAGQKRRYAFGEIKYVI